MLYNELPIAFPWYERIEQQDRFRENVNGTCTYQLISPQNSLLPFQFYKVPEGAYPSKWEIFFADSQERIADISAAAASLHLSLVNGFEYFTFDGQPIDALALPAGYFFSVLTFPSGVDYFSEVFFVPPATAFNAESDGVIEYLKLTWYNAGGDIAPIFYNEEADNGGPIFKNVLYLDSFITASEPEITEDGDKDGNDELIPSFQKAIINYRITDLVAEFVKKAVVLIQMHDSVFVTTPGGVRSGSIEKLSVDTSLEANGARSNIDILFQDTIAIVKKGCSGNMVKTCQGDPTSMTIANGTTGNYLFQGYAAPATVVAFYGQTSLTGPRTKIAVSVTDTQLVAGVNLPQNLFTDYAYISVKATSYGCDFGFSDSRVKPS